MSVSSAKGRAPQPAAHKPCDMRAAVRQYDRSVPGFRDSQRLRFLEACKRRRTWRERIVRLHLLTEQLSTQVE